MELPAFQYHRPGTPEEVVSLLSKHAGNIDIVAGGTDLLPNLKHGLFSPKHLVSLSKVQGFDGISQDADGTMRIGAGTSLHTLATSAVLAQSIPALSRAASLIAGPQHRRMGTIGGNVMLDTRCLFYNQTEAWRDGLGYCLKKDGDWCHVIGSKATCVAAQSSDSVPVLLSVDAALEVLTPSGMQSVPMSELYRQDVAQKCGVKS